MVFCEVVCGGCCVVYGGCVDFDCDWFVVVGCDYVDVVDVWFC